MFLERARWMDESDVLCLLRVWRVCMAWIGRLKHKGGVRRVGIQLKMQILARCGSMTGIQVAAVAIGRLSLWIQYGLEMQLVACLAMRTVSACQMEAEFLETVVGALHKLGEQLLLCRWRREKRGSDGFDRLCFGQIDYHYTSE